MTEPVATDEAAVLYELLRCPSGCMCSTTPDAADSHECACDGICCTEDWEPWLERQQQAIRAYGEQMKAAGRAEAADAIVRGVSIAKAREQSDE